MVADSSKSLVVTFDDAEKARYADGIVDRAGFREAFLVLFKKTAGFSVDIRGGTAYISHKFSRRGGGLLLTFFDSTGGDHRNIGYARVQKPMKGHVCITDIRIYQESFRGRGLGRAVYDYIDLQLNDLGGRVITPLTTLEPDGRRFWERRDAQGLVLRDLYISLSKGEMKSVEIYPDHALWDVFSTLE